MKINWFKINHSKVYSLLEQSLNWKTNHNLYDLYNFLILGYYCKDCLKRYFDCSCNQSVSEFISNHNYTLNEITEISLDLAKFLLSKRLYDMLIKNI